MENLRFGHKIMKRVKDMGMYDELLITRTYLKDLLTKEQEKVLKSHDNVYQTKSLENGLMEEFLFLKVVQPLKTILLNQILSSMTRVRWVEE